jgi:hypothetical protein
MRWVDPECSGVLVKLMKREVQAEEDAKKWEEEKLAKTKQDAAKQLKKVQPQLHKATDELKSSQIYRHNVKLMHVMLAKFVIVLGLILSQS